MHLQLLTDGQSHDFQLVAHQLDHHALLQRRGSAAQHRAATARHRQELVLQAAVQGVGQGAAVDHQAQPVDGGVRGRPVRRRRRRRRRIDVEGGEVGMEGLGRAAQEFGLDVV